MRDEADRPPPPAPRCPVCGTAYSVLTTDVGVGPCRGCGLDLDDPLAEQIRVIDTQRAHLTDVRASLAERLSTGLVRAVAADTAAPPSPPSTHDGGTGRPLPPAPRPDNAEGDGAQLTVPVLLGLTGAGLLTAAAVVFTAVSWDRLTAPAQALLLVSAVAAAAVGALIAARRHLPTTAATLGVVSAALAGTVLVGAQRSGLLELDDHTPGASAAALAVIAWLLARAGVRWVPLLGALGLVTAGTATTIAIGTSTSIAASQAAVVGTVLAGVTALTVRLWTSPPARTAVLLGAAGLALGSGLVGAGQLARPEVGALSAAAAVVLPAALFALASRWRPSASAPTVLVATAGGLAWLARAGVDDTALVAAAAGLASLAVWTPLPAGHRTAARFGALPVGVVAGAGALAAGTASLVRWTRVLSSAPAPETDPWLAVAAILVLIGLCVLPTVRTRLLTTGLVGAVIVSGALPEHLAVLLLLVAAGAVAAAAPPRPGTSIAALVTAGFGTGYASAEATGLTAAAAVTALLAVAVIATRRDVARRTGCGFAAAAVGLAVGSGLTLLGVGHDPAVVAGTALTFLVAAVAARIGADAPVTAGVVVGFAAMALGAELVGDLRAQGVLLLLSATGWTLLAFSGRRALRWVAAAAASVGSALLAADAGVTVVEAYTGPPALALALAGLWWLADEPRTRTLTALAPALTTAAAPSLVLLVARPDALLRTVLVALVAAGVLAIGVAVRWLAPTVYGAFTALAVAAIQLGVLVSQAPRWVAFALAGVLLVWLAATYERQQLRVHRLRGSLADFR